MFDRTLLRAVRWARNPPSTKRVKFFLALLAFCILVATIEHFFGWPEFLTVENKPRRLPQNLK